MSTSPSEIFRASLLPDRAGIYLLSVLYSSKPTTYLMFIHKTEHKDDINELSSILQAERLRPVEPYPYSESAREQRRGQSCWLPAWGYITPRLLKSLETEANSLEDHSVLSCFFKNRASLITGSEDCMRMSRFLSSMN